MPDDNATIAASSGQQVRPAFGWPRLLSVELLAAYLGLSPQTIRNRASRGDIPGARKIGRRRVFDRRVIDKWLDRGDDFRDLWLDARRK